MTSSKTATTRLCPYCAKAQASTDNKIRPFCSDRCKALDLAAWANESYRIAGPSQMPLDSESDEDDENLS